MNIQDFATVVVNFLMRPATRLIVAAVVAPLSPVLLVLALGGSLSHVWGTDQIVIVISVVTGIPAYFFLRYKKYRSLGAHALAAFICGTISMLLLFAVLLIWGLFKSFSIFADISTMYFNQSLTVVIGSMCIGLLYMPIGILFWTIARPDKDRLWGRR